ncbi:MAG: hypothetical protein WEB03_07275 [Nitriliruptor sp.]|uniref:hypothetical protein n=1 Tax=Nitriliruptor sp. TaxID=2448056 RepID=UPI0034A025F7
MKHRKLFTAALATTMALGLLTGTAGAHHRTPSIQFNDAALGADLSVALNTPVTVTGEAFQKDSADLKEAAIQRCVLEGAHVAAESCDGGAGTWTTVASTSGPSHAAVTYEAPTSVAGVFGYRTLTAGDEADTANLTVTSGSTSQRHNACNGIENAHSKVKDDAKAKQKLAEHAEKFGCDVE